MAASDLRSCFVTGGTGFIGSHLVDLLLSRGVEVRCLVRDPDRLGWLQGRPVQVVRGDLFSEAALSEGADGVDAVFHLAGVTAARRGSDYLRINAMGCLPVAQAALTAPRSLKVFVYVSSLAVAGPSVPGRARVETDPPAPVTDYGLSKLEGERLLRAQAGLPLVVVRPPTVYGPRDRGLLEFFRLARMGMLPLANPKADLSLIHAVDLAHGLVLAAEKGAIGQAYYLAAEPPVRSVELPALLAGALGRSVRGVRIPRGLLWSVAAASEGWAAVAGRAAIFNRQKARELAASGWVCSAAKAGRDLGFTCRIGHAEGLRSTAEWYRSRGWIR